MKLDAVFGLESASWPALAVDAAGVIRRANRTAIQILGPNLESGTVRLADLWLAENGITPDQFLARSQQYQAALAPLKLMGDGNMTLPFQASVCAVSSDDEKLFLFQLLPQSPSIEV